MNNKIIIEQFYDAFANLDAEKMVSFYHDDIEFTDPAFGLLKGERAKAMWRMLCQNSTDLKIEASQMEADGNNGKARWDAYYTFSQTGKKVHNIIDATFEFKDGKIIKHTDHFNIKRWAGQALGLKGKLLGGTSFFKKKLNQQTGSLLDKFMK